MDTVIGVVLWVLIIAAIARWRSARRRTPARTGTPPGARSASRVRDTNPIPGWIAGHYIARNHHGFPGDPLPHGHLGSPVDLAFWGGMFDDDERDDEDQDDV